MISTPPFGEDMGQRKKLSPLVIYEIESLTKIGSSRTFNLSFTS